MPTFSPSTGPPRDVSPSLEQYIEAIADLLTREKVCSVSDIAEQVQVSRPAASRAVRELGEQALVEHRSYGYVDLTPKGQSIADKLTARHAVLYDFLREVLLFDDEWADQEACRLEHQVDDALVDRLSQLSNFFAANEEMGAQWARKLRRTLKQ
ncbi:MAG: metal-dependent transcriptional regulator [Candidatus Hydrogenedentes bacterium]|nr:metal-dependent transcriptional regulator [Candidatus Hydrogenedentota bacterium]